MLRRESGYRKRSWRYYRHEGLPHDDRDRLTLLLWPMVLRAASSRNSNKLLVGVWYKFRAVAACDAMLDIQT